MWVKNVAKLIYIKFDSIEVLWSATFLWCFIIIIIIIITIAIINIIIILVTITF